MTYWDIGGHKPNMLYVQIFYINEIKIVWRKVTGIIKLYSVNCFLFGFCFIPD